MTLMMDWQPIGVRMLLMSCHRFQYPNPGRFSGPLITRKRRSVLRVPIVRYRREPGVEGKREGKRERKEK